MRNGCYKTKEITKYYKNNELHREDGPALIDKIRKIHEWWFEGKLHRENGPARLWEDNSGKREWYKNGKKHRENGPAIIDKKNHIYEWWFEGKLHRETTDDKPAVIYGNYHLIWYKHGEIHRKNGPANIYCSGTEIWYKNGYVHRMNGPAKIIGAPGGKAGKAWYKQSKVHRIPGDGPAEKYVNGNEYWFYMSLFHREDGPAIIFTNGTVKYFLYDQEFEEEEFIRILKRKQRRKMIYFKNRTSLKYKNCKRNIYEDFVNL